MQDPTQSLLDHGYTPIDEVKGVTVGAPVHHVSEQHYDAYANGTATVLGIYERTRSSWSQSYGTPDIELVIRRDRDDEIGQWADYHTVLAAPAEVTG